MVFSKKPIVLAKKTGFVNITPERPLIIRDMRGKLFYTTADLKVNTPYFNMPSGSYQLVEGNIKPLKQPVKYPLAPLPKPERKYPSPFKFDIIFGENPNKCSIIWKARTILFDNELLNKTEPELYFILYHEYSHRLYKTEKYADLAAANLMLIRGFNESQIGSAPITSLSTQQWDRKKHIVKHLLKRPRIKYVKK